VQKKGGKYLFHSLPFQLKQSEREENREDRRKWDKKYESVKQIGKQGSVTGGGDSECEASRKEGGGETGE